jgi:hypothetical protein
MIKEKVKHILTDADGVLVNWNTGFVKFMANHGFPQLPDTDGYYGIEQRHGVTREQAKLAIKEFNESEGVAYLDAFADAQEYVGKLANLGFRFTVITSLSSVPKAKDRRTENLVDLYGDIFDEVVCLQQGSRKYDELMRWHHSGLFWIEDHVDQALDGYNVGLRPILIDHPYNANLDSHLFPRVSNDSPWKEIYELVCKDYGLENV